MILHITKMEFIRVCFPPLLPVLCFSSLSIQAITHQTFMKLETMAVVLLRHHEFTCALTGSILISSDHKSQPAGSRCYISMRSRVVLCCCVTCLIISYAGCVVSTSQLSCERQNVTNDIITRVKSRNEVTSGSPYIFIETSAVRVVCSMLMW
jgi:hypothetical protein